MSSISSRWIVFLLGYTTFLGSVVCGLRCYVCDSDKSNLMNCDNFDPTNENFGKECPPDKSAACLASLSNGRVTLRDCESININDCSMANNVEYCYCSEDLCNGKLLPHGDDEDDNFEGGSGMFSTTTTTVATATVSLTTQMPRHSVAHCLNAKLHVVFISAVQYFIRQYYYSG